jgi:hypothetical protein
MTAETIFVTPMPEPSQNRVRKIVEHLLTGKYPARRCSHVDSPGAAFTCSFDYVEIGLLCATCIQAHMLLDDAGFAVCDACREEDQDPFVPSVQDGWVPLPIPPRIEILEGLEMGFWEGHLTIVNAIMCCQKHAEKLVVKGRL